MDDLNQLFNNAIACVNSMKHAADAFISRLEGMRAASLRADADLQEKQRLAAAESDRLRSQIHELNQERAKAERQLQIAQRDVEKGKKQISALKDEYNRTVERAFAPVTAA